jgi:signal peptidase I
VSRAEQEPGGRDGGGLLDSPDSFTEPVRPAEEEKGESAPPPDRPPGQTRGERRRFLRRQKRTSFLREFPVLIIIAFLLALLIKTFFVQAFWIPSASMERTLLINDRVLVNKLVYDFRDPRKGDIVVFNGDGTGFQSSETTVAPPSNVFARVVRDISGVLGLGAPSDKDFIKRVIAVGGDTVSCCDVKNRVMVNGKPINEPYLFEDNAMKFGPVTVPKGDLWVMGDHRGDSQDSRFDGPIPASKVVGRAFVRVWPVSRIGFLSAPNIYGAAAPALAGAVLVVPLVGRRRRRLDGVVRPGRAGRGGRTARARRSRRSRRAGGPEEQMDRAVRAVRASGPSRGERPSRFPRRGPGLAARPGSATLRGPVVHPDAYPGSDGPPLPGGGTSADPP